MMAVHDETPSPLFNTFTDEAINQVHFDVHNEFSAVAESNALRAGLRISLNEIRNYLIDYEIHYEPLCKGMVVAGQNRRRVQTLRAGMKFMIQKVKRTRDFHIDLAEAVNKPWLNNFVSN